MKPRNALLPLLPLLVPLLAIGACRPMSAYVEDPAAGLNGGFEIVEDGLPVNWLVYAPDTIPSGSYRLEFDREDRREGEQSLKFVVEECASSGGWHSPGFSQQFPAEAGATYRVSLWIKSTGCDWTVSVGSVAPKTGTYDGVTSDDLAEDIWNQVEHEVTLAPGYDDLRFELSITSPGTLWVDDVRIESVGSASER